MATPNNGELPRPVSNGPNKRQHPGSWQPRKKKQKLQAQKSRVEGSHEEVLLADVEALLKQIKIDAPNPTALPAPFTEVTVTIESLSSTGDGLGSSKDHPSHLFVVPFTAPGDVVLAKVIRHVAAHSHSITDFLRVITPSPLRSDALVRCPYFTQCSGCQFQMLPYGQQLEHKQSILCKAYQNFSGLPQDVVPHVGETIGSPLEYGYRTKLTPHFDGPPGARRMGRKGERAVFAEVPPIGFMKKGTRRTLDIEECPIATAAVQMGLRRERKRVARELDRYRKGATILLRESTEAACPEETAAGVDDESGLRVDEETQKVFQWSDAGGMLLAKTCITDNNATSIEKVGEHTFQNPANAFFQNNNSILPAFTGFIRSHILGPDSPTEPITHLIDAYCGSGLFTITLSSLFSHSIGIDISAESISYARRNAILNNLLSSEAAPETPATPSEQPNISFISADSTALFTNPTAAAFPPRRTAVILDPPRKGCDDVFLRQLLAFAPRRIVYVSCNVHTQARDVGWLLRGGRDADADADAVPADHNDAVGEVPPAARVFGARYKIESLTPFDFFPQTAHVEGVAVLCRVD